MSCIYSFISYKLLNMGTIAKVFSTIEKLKKIKKKFGKQDILYTFFFQDNLYGIAYNRFINKSNYKNLKNLDLENPKFFKFLTIKRLIKKIRKSDFLWIVSQKSINKFEAVEEVIVIIFDFIFGFQLKKPFKKKMNNWNSYQSIHSIFPFMEDKFSNSKKLLDITIPYFFHPEFLIRIFRRHIRDISFLHFLRIILHTHVKFTSLNVYTFVSSKKIQFFSFLWNVYIYELEYILNNIWKNSFRFQSVSFWFFVDTTTSIQKIKYIIKRSKNVIIPTIVKKNSSIHYVRYKNNFLISFNENNNLIIENWKYFFIIFFQKYFHVWVQPYRISIIFLNKNSLSFLGYIFNIKTKFIFVQIKIISYLLNAYLIQKEFCGIIPIVFLIKLLAKEKFCDTSGRPICKLAWTTLTDNEIFERFDQITKNIFCYYSGCFNKKGLYQLQYIFRFSCAKTLACKHKSTIRTVWKKYGSNFFTNYLFLKKTKFISLNFWQIDPYKKKIWYLNIIQINSLANLLQKLKNSKNIEKAVCY